MVETIREPVRETPVLRDVDVLVVGGSQSGVAAAFAAKRAAPNLNVLLIEQLGYLGGQSVADMVIHWEFREYTNNSGVDVAAGIGKEMIRRIVEKGNSDPLYSAWLDGRGPPFTEWPDGRAVGDIPLDLEDIKLVLLEMCEEAGVEVFFLAKAVAALPLDTSTGLPASRGIIIETYNGRYAIKAKVVVDCSANNDVAWFVGGMDAVEIPAPFMTMQAYLWIGGVDCMKFVEAAWEDPRPFGIIYPDNKEQMIEFVQKNISITLRGGGQYFNEIEERYPTLLEEYENLGPIPNLNFWLKTNRTKKYGDTYIGTWAVEGPNYRWDQVDYESVSKVHASLLKACHLMLKMHQVMPGWENAFIERTPDRIGFRQTRVLKGLYTLTGDDVFTNAAFEDKIGHACGHDQSRGRPQVEMGYDIPYRALVPATIDGLLVGARSISCDVTDEKLLGLNASRGISATIIASQAAGTAAAMAVVAGVEPRNVDVPQLQEALRRQNVLI
jgi:hypothetical protein